MVLEAAPKNSDKGGGSDGKRTKSGEDALRDPFGGVGVGGARFFACISSRSFGSSLTFPFVVRPLLWSLTFLALLFFHPNQPRSTAAWEL